MKLNKIEPKFIKKNNPRIGLITLASDFRIERYNLWERYRFIFK
jgi:maleate isomerase